VTAVRSEVDARRVVRITLDRPERKNAFDAELIADLTSAILGIDPAARAVVLQSEGDTFCAGADIDWMRGMADFSLEENVADSRALAGMFRAIHDLPMPVVARVQGAAIGGGAGLVAVTDIAVTDTARLRTGESSHVHAARNGAQPAAEPITVATKRSSAMPPVPAARAATGPATTEASCGHAAAPLSMSPALSSTATSPPAETTAATTMAPAIWPSGSRAAMPARSDSPAEA